MNWRGLLKFRRGESRPRIDSLTLKLCVEGHYQFDQPDGHILLEDDPVENIAMVTGTDSSGVPEAMLAVSLLTVEGEPMVLINSIDDRSQMASWSQFVGTDPLCVGHPLTRRIAMCGDWSPVTIRLTCGWLPRRGVFECRFMFEAGDEPRTWIEIFGRGEDGVEFFHYFGRGGSSVYPPYPDEVSPSQRRLWRAVRELSSSPEIICRN